MLISENSDFSISDTHSSSTTSIPTLRRSTRVHKAPIILHDYVCHLSTHDISEKQQWCNLVSFNNIAPHMVLNANAIFSEPTSYEDAATNPRWITVIMKFKLCNKITLRK